MNNLHPIFRDILAANPITRGVMANAPMATTSPAAIRYIAALTPAEAEHLTDIADLSFAELVDAIDEAADETNVDWHALDELKAERDGRICDATFELQRRFVHAMEHASTPSTPKLPIVTGKRIVQEPVTILAHEFVSCSGSIDPVLRILAASPENVVAERARYFSEMAAEYAKANAEELLHAGWAA